MKTILSASLALGLAACTSGPDYVRPSMAAAPAATSNGFVSTAPGVATDEPPADWWRIYEDPVLDRLVTQALAANTDLRVALANLKAADAVLGEARTARLPQTTTSAGTSYGRSQAPLYLPGDRFTYSAGLQLSYEVDLFGRVSRTIEAARADAAALAYAHAAVRVRVVAQVTDAYLSACTLSSAIATTRDSIALTEKSAGLIRLQQQAGSAAVLDVARAEAQVSDARATLPPLEEARANALFELAALLGTTPSQIPEAAARCGSPPGPHRPLPIGDVAGLLARRPDVAQAERQLAAATARIGVATADLYPRISIGASATKLGGDRISGAQGFAFGVGPLLNFSFPNISAARARIRGAEARTEGALASFDGTVLTALKETEQALTSYASATRTRDERRVSEAKSDQAFRLADLRYRNGSIAYVDVIVAQRDLITARLERIDADRALASSRVMLFRALGSGWEQERAS